MHVASVAANAIVELFRDRAVSRVKELDREILTFSVSHDHVNVKIHGHYARIEGDKITLHRHLMREFGLRDQNGREKWTTYHVVRKIYDYFVPIHLERIRGAISQLSVGSSFGISSASLESNTGGDKETESAEGAPSSQGTDRAKKPRLKPTAVLQKENDYLKERLAQSEERLNAVITQIQAPSNASTTESELQRFQYQLEERDRQRHELQELRAQERAQFNALIQQLQTSNANAGNDSEVVTMLRQQNAEMKEQMSKLMETLQSLSAQPRQRGRK